MNYILEDRIKFEALVRIANLYNKIDYSVPSLTLQYHLIDCEFIKSILKNNGISNEQIYSITNCIQYPNPNNHTDLLNSYKYILKYYPNYFEIYYNIIHILLENFQEYYIAKMTYEYVIQNIDEYNLVINYNYVKLLRIIYNDSETAISICNKMLKKLPYLKLFQEELNILLQK